MNDKHQTFTVFTYTVMPSWRFDNWFDGCPVAAIERDITDKRIKTYVHWHVWEEDTSGGQEDNPEFLRAVRSAMVSKRIPVGIVVVTYTTMFSTGCRPPIEAQQPMFFPVELIAQPR